ncbi:uncharacterized protein LOC111343523 isoform X2 [Stylophora pistillata]|uniref:uncharacterized protein LOC111343523 isoform X2 n=1 Tax=Stylophora pistillata TaxID=50429 RepID=UPI000C04E614|nr:uncharacterized protein LOC111343523 isoform X2 [Stylophora pistillata]
MAETAEDHRTSSENETSGVTGSAESIDLSCIHWGYLNCTPLKDPKKIKDNIWQTFWVDLCGSTLRLYKDLSLPQNSADSLPPSSLIGPSNENEKKEAFIVLRKGAEVKIIEPGFESHKSQKRRLTVNRRHVFKVSFNSRGANSPSYVFQAPSKGSMYRWISKIEEGIDMSDKPQNESATDKRLKEAKLLSVEQQRFHVAPELRILDRDDIDSGMEGDVEEVYETSKKLADNPRLELMKKRLQDLEDLVQQLEKEEEAFLGGNHSILARRCEFQSTTNKDYFLIPGHSRTLIPKGTELTILGQLPNNRWRCFVKLPRSKSAGLANGQHLESSSEVESISSFETADDEDVTNTGANTDTLIGSVPNSLLNDLIHLVPCKLKCEDGTPVASPGVTPQLSPIPSPPQSPYSPHRNNRDSSPSKRSSLRRSIASENLSEQDIWEQFCIPSPPSSPVTSRSTSPSLSLSCSPGGSLEDLDFVDKENCETVKPMKNREHSEVILRRGREKDDRDFSKLKSHREATFMIDDIPETYIGSDSEDDKMVTVIDEVPPHEVLASENVQQEPVKMRVKKDQSHRDSDSKSIAALQPNYAFLVTKKLRQRGISLIVGSSSSEDENDDDKDKELPSRLSQRRLDKEFLRFGSEGTEQGVRPYSGFVSRKQVGITLSTEVQNFVPRTSTRNELLRDYSSPSDTPPTIVRANTLTTIEKLGDWSSTENAPPINQRRTLQLSKASSAGFGFTLQTYGIVQQAGQVEHMTFILKVEEDGPAYMAGLRPGDIILEVDGENVEEEDHKAVVARIHQASISVRLVVVFVDALRRMKLNTRLKLLQAQLADKEFLFQELCKREEQILQGKGISSSEMSLPDLPQERTNSYLYTTELTSCFSKQSPNVHDSILQQALNNKEPRRRSLPDQVELGKQRITATTGSEMLKKFSSPDLSAQRRKPISAKLIKGFRKKKPSEESFKSYLELDLDTENPDKEEETEVFEPAVTTAEALAVAASDEPRTLERETPMTSDFIPLDENPKLSSLLRSNSEQNSSPTLYKEFSENPDVSNKDRIAPGIAQMKKRFEKSSSSKTLPTKSPKPVQVKSNGSTLD